MQSKETTMCQKELHKRRSNQIGEGKKLNKEKEEIENYAKKLIALMKKEPQIVIVSEDRLSDQKLFKELKREEALSKDSAKYGIRDEGIV